MKRFSTLFLLAGLALGALPRQAFPHQASAESRGQAPSYETREPVAVRVTLRDQRVMEGLLVGFSGRAIVLRLGGQAQALGPADIVSLAMVKDVDRMPGLVTGALLGAYLSRALFYGRSYGSTPYFVESNGLLWEALNVLLGFGPGVLTGWLSDLIVNKPAKTYRSAGGAGFAAEEWDRIRARLAGAKIRQARLHLSADAGRVFPHAVDDSQAGLNGRGANRDVGMFNMLRRFRLEYSLSPAWRVGYTFALLGEPSVWQYGAGDWSGSSSIEQDSRGHYLTVSFSPFSPRIRPGAWIASIGLGAGLAALKLRNEFWTWGSDYFSGSEGVSQRVPSGMIFGSLRLQLYRHLSLGLTGDWVWAPSQELAPVPRLGWNTRRISFASASIGFCLGLHL